MNAPAHRPWLLVGPWYRWQRPGVPSAGRASRPVFQKYDSPKLIEQFLANPQRSLRFTDDDLVSRLSPLSSLAPPLFNGLRRRLSENRFVKTDTRKLFLDTHKRFYLVVCEAHCEAPGLPSVTRDQICQAGFVVRRRALIQPGDAAAKRGAAKEARPILAAMATAQNALKQLDAVHPQQQLATLKKGRAPLGQAMLAEAVATSLDSNRAAAVAQLSEAKTQLDVWARRWQVTLGLQGWRLKADRVGEWFGVGETPGDTGDEQIFPLYPLIPDPRQAAHAGTGKTIYFGLVPTGSADTDDTGHARFDESRPYEIRCFVRRHKPQCPKINKKPDCHGQIFWSPPTDAYQIAPHFDLVGTSNQPVSIQLPDLAALEAQAAALPPNQLAPVRMVASPGSNLEVEADQNGKITQHGIFADAQICSFSIPLITIVATFVFKLFLPVVTLLFGLFFLLKLKFCIPPSVEIDADIAAALDLKPPSLDGSFGLDVEAEFDVGGSLAAKLETNLQARFGTIATAGLKDPSKPGLSPAMRAQLTTQIGVSSEEVNRPSLTANLEYEADVHVEAEVTPA